MGSNDIKTFYKWFATIDCFLIRRGKGVIDMQRRSETYAYGSAPLPTGVRIIWDRESPDAKHRRAIGTPSHGQLTNNTR
jgi:hypothetical protein